MPISRAAKKLWRKTAPTSRIILHGQRIVVRAPHVDAELRRALTRGRYERHKTRQLRNRIEPNDVVLDVGTGIGLTALYAAGMVGADNVLCVEPDPRAAALARRNFDLNRQPISLLEAAAAPAGAPERMGFHLNEALGRSSLKPRAGTVETLSVATLDVAPMLRERRAANATCLKESRTSLTCACCCCASTSRHWATAAPIGCSSACSMPASHWICRTRAAAKWR